MNYQVFREPKPGRKKWSFKLIHDIAEVDVVAVDSHTGKKIATLCTFTDTGCLHTSAMMFEAMQSAGYDTDGITFDEHGAIAVD